MSMPSHTTGVPTATVVGALGLVTVGAAATGASITSGTGTIDGCSAKINRATGIIDPEAVGIRGDEAHALAAS